MPACVSLKGSLTKEDFRKLYKGCKDLKLRERYQAMYLSFSYDWNEIAEIFCVDYETVLNWVHLYNQYGIEGLALGKPPGRASSLTDGQLDETKSAVRQCPRELGLKFSNWAAGRLARWIADRFGVLLCYERIRQILHCMGFSYVKPTYSYILADRKERRAFLQDFKEVAGSGEAFMFEDESTVEQHPTLHGMWVLKGTKAKIRTFGNHVKRHVFAAVDPVTGKVVSMVAKRLTADAFIGFLSRLLAEAIKPFTLILDNSPCHRAKSVMQFLEQHKSRITILWLPKYSPDLDPAEQVWKDMKLNVCHNYLFGTANRLSWGIRCYFRQLKPEKIMSLCNPGYLLV